MSSLKALKSDEIIPSEVAAEKDFEAYVQKHKFDRNNPPAEEEHLFYYSDVPIGSKGNLVSVTGRAKSRKTVLTSAIASSCFVDDHFLGFSSQVSKEENILHVDSEQGVYHYYHSTNRILNDADIKTGVPSNFHSVNVRDADEEFRFELLEYLFKKLNPSVAIIDGISDFSIDDNDDKEVKRVGRKIIKLAIDYNCLIIVVIHTTKSTGYMSGKLGTYLEKKSQTVIKVEKEEDNEEISHVYCQYARDKGFKSFGIQYNEQIHRYELLPETHVIRKGPKGDKSPGAYSVEIHQQVILRAFGFTEVVPPDELGTRIHKAFRSITGDTLIGRDIKRMIDHYNGACMIVSNGMGWMRPAFSPSEKDAGQQTTLFTGQKDGDVMANEVDDLPF
jgi:hypothetical protein